MYYSFSYKSIVIKKNLKVNDIETNEFSNHVLNYKEFSKNQKLLKNQYFRRPKGKIATPSIWNFFFLNLCFVNQNFDTKKYYSHIIYEAR